MEPFGTAVFCDDIRFELSNKISLVGVYGYEMVLFGSFPATLPKLGIFSAVRFPKTQKIPSVKILIYFPGDQEDSPSHTQDIPIQLAPDDFPTPDPSEFPDPSEYYGFNYPILFSPIILRQSGYIRIRAVEGDTRIKVGTMKVREALPNEIAQPVQGNAPS
jgi:hypothetical protein